MAATDSYTVEHVANVCHVTPRTLATWRKRKQGPPWAKFGLVVLYPSADFEKWFAAQVCRPVQIQADSDPGQQGASIQ